MLTKKKWQITVDHSQALALIQALDLYSRIFMGQIEEITRYGSAMIPAVPSGELAEWFNNIKLRMFPELPSGHAYHGIHSPKIDDTARVAWDLQQVIRYRVSWDTENTNDNDQYRFRGVNFDPPLRSSEKVGLAEIVEVPAKKAKWEYFCDECNFHTWCVRKKGERRSGFGYHVTSEEEAKSLCAELNK